MPSIRADIIEVYVACASSGGPRFLQLRRTTEPLAGTWQPVMGHVEPGETAVRAAVRELSEEVGLRAGDDAWLGFWQLEDVHPYFIARLDAVMLSPRLLVLVDGSWRPDLRGEATHDQHRWVAAPGVEDAFMWPGQVRACREAMDVLAKRGSAFERALRLDPPGRPDDRPGLA